ncbi:MAG TPA: MFS transporter [Dehalococcoidia bacterium]|nr:MFS transporter [Dehalococcoidia bacterium]
MQANAETPPLSLPRRLLFASGSFGANVTFQTLATWLLFFYAPSDSDRETLVPIGAVGVILLIGRIIEAVDDPLIGYWSDVFRSRWGRRLPFILFGSPVLALTFFLLWVPPVGHESLWNALWLFVVLEAFFFANTVVGGPYEALLPEVARSSQERISLSALKVYFGAAGAGVVFLAGGVLVSRAGFGTMGAVMALLALASRLAPVAALWGRPSTGEEPERPGFVYALRETLRNDQFVAYMPAFVLFTAAQTMLTQLFPYFVDVVLRDVAIDLPFTAHRLEDTGEKVSFVTALFFVPLLASVTLMSRVARAKGKRWTYGVSMLATGLGFPLMFFVGFIPGVPNLVETLFLLGLAAPMAALFVFPNALLADITDYDEQRTGMRREAIYYGAQATLQKAGLGLAAGVFGGLLDLFGKTADDPLGIRLVGPAAGALTLAGWYVFHRRYRLD